MVRRPTEQDLADIFEATVTLLYRLLFLLHAESRKLLPVHEAPYREASLLKIMADIAEQAGTVESETAARLADPWSATETTLYDRLARLCRAIDRGEPTLNVPACRGGLFASLPSPAGRGAGGEGGGGGEGNSRTGSTSVPPWSAKCPQPNPLPEGERTESRQHRAARFLAEHKVPDRWLALAIDRLARVPNETTSSLAFIDYQSLDVRHLGSIYEGLLEFKLKIAEEDLTITTIGKQDKHVPLSKAKPKRGRQAEVVVRKGQVYLSNDKMERKASGSYYTPEPIVAHIVEHTLGPLLAEKLEKLRPEFRKARETYENELQKAASLPPRHDQRQPCEIADELTYQRCRQSVADLFDFRVLDPAMGSGHFLVAAADLLTNRLLAFLNEFPVNPVRSMLDRARQRMLEALAKQEVSVAPHQLTDARLVKRHVLNCCIYGVDLDPMAVELAKTSLWLDASMIGTPLSFLDRHLRCGNSLIGATLHDLDTVTQPMSQRAPLLPETNHEPLFEALRHGIEADQQIESGEAEAQHPPEKDAAVRTVLSRYRVALDLLVAKDLGCNEALDLLEAGGGLDFSNPGAPSASFAESAATKKDRRPTAEVLAVVERLARSQDLRFFHWELEFPDAFFGSDYGDPRRVRPRNDIAPGSAGFDCVIGNPPYLGVRTGSLSRMSAGYAVAKYTSARRNWDVSGLFVEASLRLAKRRSALGMIVPTRLCTNRDFAALRQRVFALGGPAQVVQCGQAFGDPAVLASVVIARMPPDTSAVRMGYCCGDRVEVDDRVPREVLRDLPDQPFFTTLREEQLPAFSLLSTAPIRLGSISRIVRGMECGKNDPHVRRTRQNGDRPVISGEGVREFVVVPQGLYIPAGLGPASKYKPQLFADVPRLLLRFVAPYPIAAVDYRGILNFNTVYNVVLHSGGLDEYAALACLLNSSAVRWWFTTAFNAGESLFPHIQKYQLQEIPLPGLDLGRADIRQLAAIGREAINGRDFHREAMERLSFEAFGALEIAHLLPNSLTP